MINEKITRVPEMFRAGAPPKQAQAYCHGVDDLYTLSAIYYYMRTKKTLYSKPDLRLEILMGFKAHR